VEYIIYIYCCGNSDDAHQLVFLKSNNRFIYICINAYVYTFYTVCGVYSGPVIVSLAVCTQKLTRQPAAAASTAPPFIRGQDAIAYNLSPSLSFAPPHPLFARSDQSLSLTLSILRNPALAVPLTHSLSLSPSLTLVISSLIRQTFSSLLQTHARTHACTHTRTRAHIHRGLYICECTT